MKCYKPDRKGGPLSHQALPYGRASDTETIQELIMLKRFLVIASIVLLSATLAWAQNSNSSTITTRTRTVEPKPSPTPKAATKSNGTPSTSQRPKSVQTASPSSTVLAAFNNLLDGNRHANVKAVTTAYQNTSRLVLFNNNGTGTRGWDQMTANHETSYT